MIKPEQLSKIKLKVKNSSRVETIIFDMTTMDEGEMKVYFQSGHSYIYHNIPWEEFNELAEAESTGKAFQNIINKGYKYTKLT